MLLATPFLTNAPQRYLPYSPPRPSPLGERSANTARLFSLNMPFQSEFKKAAVPSRAYKTNPVMQTRDAATKRRRDMFFRRVKGDRDDKQWKARGEQIQQLDFHVERRRWEAEKARQAPGAEDTYDEEALEDMSQPDAELPVQQHERVSEADILATQEAQDLQYLIESMVQHVENTSQHYSSDDEDYDAIFMEYASSVDMSSHQQLGPDFQCMDNMDTDMMDG